MLRPMFWTVIITQSMWVKFHGFQNMNWLWPLSVRPFLPGSKCKSFCLSKTAILIPSISYPGWYSTLDLRTLATGSVWLGEDVWDTVVPAHSREGSHRDIQHHCYRHWHGCRQSLQYQHQTRSKEHEECLGHWERWPGFPFSLLECCSSLWLWQGDPQHLVHRSQNPDGAFPPDDKHHSSIIPLIWSGMGSLIGFFVVAFREYDENLETGHQCNNCGRASSRWMGITADSAGKLKRFSISILSHIKI